MFCLMNYMIWLMILFSTYSSYCRNSSVCLGEVLHMPSCFCVLGASGWETKDKPGGGHDERPTCSLGERTGEHAGQSTGQLPGAPDHADKGEGFNFFHYPYYYYTILDTTLSHQYCGRQSGVWKMWRNPNLFVILFETAWRLNPVVYV